MEEKKLFTVTSNPIVRTARSTDKIMLDVIIALVPALGVGAYMFGMNVAILLVVNVAACVFFEWGYRKLLKKNTSVGRPLRRRDRRAADLRHAVATPPGGWASSAPSLPSSL